MSTWRNTTLTIGLSAFAVGQAFAQGMAPAPTPPPATPMTAPTPVQVPVVTPSGTPSLPQSSGPVINRPRLEKPSQAGSVEMTWLGHAAWVVRSPSGTTVLIDPWLTNPRAPQDFVMPETVDAILVTHGHFDHLGQTAELAKKLHAPVIASFEVVEHLAHFGVTNGIHTNPGGTTKIKDLAIHAVTAVHSSSIEAPMPPMMPPPGEGEGHQCQCHKNMPVEAIKQTAADAAKATVEKLAPSKADALKGKKPAGKKGKLDAGAAPGTTEANGTPVPPHECTCHHGDHEHGEGHDHEGHGPHKHLMYGGAAMGFVIEMEGGPTLYHAGDTDVFGDMKLIAERFHPDIAMLPVGGVFSMDPKAAALAVELLGVKEVLPMHYGTMAQLTGTPSALKDAIAERKMKNKPRLVAPNPGERVTYIEKK